MRLTLLLLLFSMIGVSEAQSQNAPRTIPAKPVQASFSDPAAYEKALFEWLKEYDPATRSAYRQYEPDTIYNGYTDAQLKKMSNADVQKVMGVSDAKLPANTTPQVDPTDPPKEKAPVKVAVKQQYDDEALRNMSEAERRIALGLPAIEDTPPPAKVGRKSADKSKYIYTRAEFESLTEETKAEVKAHPERFEIKD